MLLLASAVVAGGCKAMRPHSGADHEHPVQPTRAASIETAPVELEPSITAPLDREKAEARAEGAAHRTPA